jgi:hypothetical protein
MIKRLLMMPIIALILTTTCSGTYAARRMQPLSMPPASMRNPDYLVTPPGENQYFFLGAQGTPYYLNIDETVNWTDALNRTYFNPRWRGEDWTPLPFYWIVERQCRLLSSWDEYNEFSIYHVGNKFHQFFEKYSGFGP